MSWEAIAYIVNLGVKIIGIDTFNFDRPVPAMIGDFLRTKDNSYLWPAHFYGREKEYCHIERLANLGKIPQPYGFKVACFPIKIKETGAAWARVVAIFE
jgi:kynurenine formamidase